MSVRTIWSQRFVIVAAIACAASVGLVAAGQSFQSLQGGFTQDLVGTTQMPSDQDGFASVLGGVAFAPDGDVWTADCLFSGTRLHRFDVQSVLPVTHGTSTVHPEMTIVTTQGGCGLTNHPSGFLFSNSSQGVWKLNASTGLPAPGPNPLGPAGNALGITVDPQTGHLVYAGADCHPTLQPDASTCTFYDLDPTSGLVTLFAQMPDSNVPFVDGIYFEPAGNYLFLANRGQVVGQNFLTVVSRPAAPVIGPSAVQIVQAIPMTSEPDGVSFHATAPKFVVTNDESNGTMTRFDFPGDDYTQPPSITMFAGGGFRGDLVQVGVDGCIYATQGRFFLPDEHATRYDDGTETTEDSLVKICAVGGGGFAPPEGVPETVTAGGVVGLVFTDTNGNGVQDAGETGVSGVTVTLTGSDNTTHTTTTDSTGSFSVTDLPPGTYTITLTDLPPGTVVNEQPTTVIVSAHQNTTVPPFSNVPLPQLTLSCVSIPGQIGEPYNAHLVAEGGVEPYTYSIVGGTLPAGLTLDPTTGTISGTPTTAGTYTFTAKVVDATGTAAGTTTSVCNGITIAPAAPALSCVAATTGQVGVAYSSSLVATGGVGPYTYSIVSGSLAPGLTLNPSTGAITGTPTTAGSFPFTAKVVDSRNSAAGTTTNSCGITITPLGSISGHVYADNNRNRARDAGEPPIAGVTLTLGGQSGGTTTSATDGTYTFAGLVAGSYSVAAPPTAGARTLFTTSPLHVSLTAGQQRSDVDFGFVNPNPSLSLTKTANRPSYSYVGEVVTYTYLLTNTGDVTLNGPFTVTDDKLGTFACGTATSLAPGASVNCTKTYVIQATDLGNVTSLPTGVTATVHYENWLQGVISTQDTTIIGAGPGIPDGRYPGWCIQQHAGIQLKNQPGTLYSSIGGGLPADLVGRPWNKINWVLNHKIRGAGKTDLAFFKDVQTAIWLLMGETYSSFGVSPEAQQMVADANAHPTYVPGARDVVAVIVYSDGMGSSSNSIQEEIIEVKRPGTITNLATGRGKSGSVTITSNQGQVTVTQVLQAPPAPPVDAMAWRDQKTAQATVTTTAFSTTAGNELLLAFISSDYQTGANTKVNSVSGAGLTWQLVTRANVQQGTSEIWRALASAPLSNVTVTATLSQAVMSSITVMSFKGVDTSGTNGSGAIGAVKTANGTSGAAKVTLTTTRSNSWVFGVGNDWDNPNARLVSPNQALLHQYMPSVGDTLWVQRFRNSVPVSGTAVTLGVLAPTTDRWNFAAVEIKPAP